MSRSVFSDRQENSKQRALKQKNKHSIEVHKGRGGIVSILYLKPLVPYLSEYANTLTSRNVIYTNKNSQCIWYYFYSQSSRGGLEVELWTDNSQWYSRKGVPTTSQKDRGVDAVHGSSPQRPTKNCNL